MDKCDAYLIGPLWFISLCVVRSYLEGLNEQQLIKLIRDKGEARKQQVFDTAKFQTGDYQKIKQLQDSLDQEKVNLEQADQEFKLKIDDIRSQI